MTPAQPPPGPPPTLSELVITAPRLPPSPSDVAFSIVRLGREALQASPRLDESLEEVPGFSLYRRTTSLGANPTTQGVSLRAIGSSAASRALVTLDGVPQNDPFGGWVIWSALTPVMVGEATIVRGAGAGPWGAGALTGVVALSSPDASPGAWRLDASVASLGDERAAASLDLSAGPGVLALAGGAEHDDGWIPMRAGRGPADDRLTLGDGFASARWLVEENGVRGQLAGELYQEDRSAGLAGAGSRARGASLAISAARDPAPGSIGWRADLWTRLSDLANSSVAVAPGRVSTSPADDEYATPATGVGADAALRRAGRAWTIEAGLDVRADWGEDRERFKPVAGVLTYDRRAGGGALVGGAYGEATRQAGHLTLTASARADAWEDVDGHQVERPLAGGPASLDLRFPDRGGVVPSGRLGARFALSADSWLRGAVYTGFRPPSLNELYRPFRVGNVVTKANSALVPERLAGAEAGGGAALGPLRFEATVFANRLSDAVTNLTLAFGPLNDPVAGFIPAGGSLQQRENLGAIDALGVEAGARATLPFGLTLSGGLDWTRSHVEGGAAAPQLDGLEPVETPRLVLTARLQWRSKGRWSAFVDLRCESLRFADDRNLFPVPPSTDVDAEIDWRAGRGATLYLFAQNLLDAPIATDNSAGVVDYGPPRIVGVGLRLSGG
ncbi:MAG: TonB-dependent receptor [Caulobacteraceae bacterium]